jgi:hypothetical protein
MEGVSAAAFHGGDTTFWGTGCGRVRSSGSISITTCKKTQNTLRPDHNSLRGLWPWRDASWRRRWLIWGGGGLNSRAAAGRKSRAAVDNWEQGVVHWVPNKEAKQGRRSIYRSRPRLLRIWSKLGSRRWRDIFTKASSLWHALGQSPMAIPSYTPQLATTW